MMGMLIGIILGVLAKLGYDWYRQEAPPESASDLQRRAASGLEESRQILAEVRQEVRSAAEVARDSAGSKLERLRDVATTSEGGMAGGDTSSYAGSTATGGSTSASSGPSATSGSASPSAASSSPAAPSSAGSTSPGSSMPSPAGSTSPGGR